MPESLSRNALLAKFFAQLYRGIPRTHLLKLIYESDVLAREYLGHPISNFRYIRYKHGPYDPTIEEATAELVAAGHVEERREPWYSYRKRGEYIRLFDQNLRVAFDFNLGESAVLDYVARNYIKMPFKEFVEDVIYETVPMKATSRIGERLPMDLVDNIGTRRVGFELAEIVQAEDDVRRGEFITLSEFVDELQSHAPA